MAKRRREGRRSGSTRPPQLRESKPNAPTATHVKAASNAHAQAGPRTPNGAALRFLLRAGVLMAGLYALYYFPYPDGSLPDRLLDGVLALQGRAAAWVIGWVEPGVTAQDAAIYGRFPMRVVKACSSLDAQALFCATVLSFPGSVRSKLIGLCAGVAALSLLNIGRIAALYFVGVYAPDAFDTVHEEVFPLLLVLCACASFAGWALYARRETLSMSQAGGHAAA